MPTALICGVSGQDGTYLAQLLLQKGYRVVGTSRSASAGNLERLGIGGHVEVVPLDLGNKADVRQALERVAPDEVYNLAAQSSVGASFVEPVATFAGIAGGVLNLLEAVRESGLACRVFNAGSSECFGDLGQGAGTETTAFRPVSPYGTAKASAHWMTATYRAAYGMFVCTGVLYNHESLLRPDRFVTRKIVRGAVRIAREGGQLRLGALDIARDWGWAPDYVDAMWRMLQADQPQDYVIATGHALSLRAFCHAAFEAVGLQMEDHVVSDPALRRPTDIAYAVGDPSRIRTDLGWQASRRGADVARAMIEGELGR